MTERYQSFRASPGVFPTEDWFNVLMRGIDSPLGSVLDVGSAEGVMSVLAAQKGATAVLGLEYDEGRCHAARQLAFDYGVGSRVLFGLYDATTYDPSPVDTVILSMIVHWLGPEVADRYVRVARKHVAIVYREANDHYERPLNGTWFPTQAELDDTVGGICTNVAHLLTQDNGKRISAAVYRVDMSVTGRYIHKRRPDFDGTGLQALLDAGAPFDAAVTPDGYKVRYHEGRDLLGDEPFHPVHDKPAPALTDAERTDLRWLVTRIAQASLAAGWYPTDLSLRNIIRNERGAHLVDLDEIERTDGRVDDRYLSIWRTTLAAAGIDFGGDLRELTA